MGIGLVQNEGSVFVEKEDTENTYKAEQASESAVEVLSDGLELTESKELLERNNRTGSVERVPSKIGQRGVAASIPTEFKASATEGGAPETADMYEALLGAVKTITATTSDVGHTTTTIELGIGDGAKYAKNDIIKIKEYDASAGVDEDHVTPITDVTGDTLTVLIPYKRAFTNNVEIAPVTMYYHSSNAPTLSVTNYIGGKIRQKGIGMRPTSGELSQFATGQLPQFVFGMEGLDYGQEVGTPLFTPAYDSEAGAEPPVVLCSKVYKDSTELVVNEVTVSLANTLGFLTSTASCNGKISSRITQLAVNFTLRPYKEDDDVDNFNTWNDNDGFSLFGSAHNPGQTLDEYLQNVAFYLPNCRINEFATGDQDGIATDEISGEAFKTSGNDVAFIAFI